MINNLFACFDFQRDKLVFKYRLKWKLCTLLTKLFRDIRVSILLHLPRGIKLAVSKKPLISQLLTIVTISIISN